MTESRQDQDTSPVAAKDVQPGDALDLYGDLYADPDRDPGKGLEFEFAEVEGTELETPGCIVIYTSAANFACPPEHMLYRRT